jgi:hypothetical protein
MPNALERPYIFAMDVRWVGRNMKKYENRSSAGPDGRAVAVRYWFKEVVDARPDIVAGWRRHNGMFRD